RTPLGGADSQAAGSSATGGKRTLLGHFPPDRPGESGAREGRGQREQAGANALWEVRMARKAKPQRLVNRAATNVEHAERAANRLRWRIRNRVKDLHHQLEHYLMDIILLPTFRTSQMASGTRRAPDAHLEPQPPSGASCSTAPANGTPAC